tara:strand:- start:3 stop:392 length:390 start_codon:yes stop_codon:yes gene_type:complete
MYRFLSFLVALSLSGCVLYLQEDSSSHYHNSDVVDLWLENASIQCDYNWETESSSWRLIIYADSYYGPGEIEYVYFLVEYLTTYYMFDQGAGFWEKAFHSFDYQCYEYLEFEFVGRDYEGNEAYYLLSW